MLRRRVLGEEDMGQGWITATYYYPSSFYGSPDGTKFRPILSDYNDEIIEKMECVEPRRCTIYPPDPTGNNGYIYSWSIKPTTERFKIRFYFKDKTPKDLTNLFRNKQGLEIESVDFRGCNMDKVTSLGYCFDTDVTIYTDSSWKAVISSDSANPYRETTVYYNSRYPLSEGFKKALGNRATYITLD